MQQWLKKLAEDRIQSSTDAPEQQGSQTLAELLAPVRGLLTDDEIDRYFIRDASTGRPVEPSGEMF